MILLIYMTFPGLEILLLELFYVFQDWGNPGYKYLDFYLFWIILIPVLSYLNHGEASLEAENPGSVYGVSRPLMVRERVDKKGTGI